MSPWLGAPIAMLIGALIISLPAYLRQTGEAQVIAAKAALASAEKCGGTR